MLSLVLVLFAQAPENFVVMPLTGSKYDESRILASLVTEKISLKSPEFVALADYCENMAKAVTGKEMLATMIKSKDFSHRAAAAFYFGYMLDPQNDLFLLYSDTHPLVCMAAKQSLINIAKEKFDQDVDFGPLVTDLNDKEKISICGKLWKMYMDSKEKNLKQSNK
jgi:hypothetical protein